MSHAINQASKIAAPALGGALLIWLAPQMIFLVNAFVSLSAAVLLWKLPVIPRERQAHDASKSMLQEIQLGLATVQGSIVLRPALFMMGAGYFAMFFYDTLIAPLTRALGFSQTVLGLSLAAVGAGGVLGALVLGRSKQMTKPFLLVALGSGIGAITIIGLGISDIMGLDVSASAYIGMFAVAGLCSALTVVPYRTIIQNHVDPVHIGRVTALSEAINTVALLVAPFIGAAIASMLTFGAAFVAGGLVMVFVARRAFNLRHLY